MIAIYFHFSFVNTISGGLNTFFNNFVSSGLKNNIFKRIKSINNNYDILFFGGNSKSHQIPININELKSIKKRGYNNIFEFFIGSKFQNSILFNKIASKIFYGRINDILLSILKPKYKKLIYRCDGFRLEKEDWAQVINFNQMSFIQISDFIIFQSKYSLRQAQILGYKGNNYKVIPNGGDNNLFKLKDSFWKKKKPLKILSSSWSSNLDKGFHYISKVSNLDNVEVTFVGNWPKSVDPCNVIIKESIPNSSLAKEYQSSDIFLHPGKYESCPNTAIEAILTGLPVIYHPQSGTNEIVKNNGIPLVVDDVKQTIELCIQKYDFFVSNIKKTRQDYFISKTVKAYNDTFQSLIESK